MTIKKSTVFYIILLIVYLAPSRISNAFLPYSAYVFYIGQLLFGAYFVYKYGLNFKIGTDVFFLLFLLSGILGMVFTSGADILSYIRYICWIVSTVGLFTFFSRCDENDRYNFLHSAKYMFIFTIIISWFYWYAIDLANTKIIVFFWGSEAVTTHSMIMFLTLSVYFDKRYQNKLTLTTIVCGILSFIFCVVNNSGQGMSMLLFFFLFLCINYWSKGNFQRIAKPVIISAIIAFLYYIIISFRFTNINIIVNYITTVLSKDITLTGRDQIFSECLKIFSEHPLIGYGYNNTIVDDTLGAITSQFNTAHNSILQMMIDYGLIGLAFFLIFIFGVLRRLNTIENDLNVILYFSIISMFIGGLVNLIIPTNYFLMVVFLAVGVAKENDLAKTQATCLSTQQY